MRILICYGERSGLMLADSLEEGLGVLNPTVEMLCFDVSKNFGQVIGIWEGLTTALRKGRLLKEIWDEVEGLQPDGVVLVSYPGINLFLGKRFRRIGVPVFYLAPPQVWAWGRFRVRLLREATNRVFCLFRFEQGFFKRYGIEAVYYGYPFLDKVVLVRSRENTLKQIGFEPGAKYIVFMPGSRPAETDHHEGLFVDVFRLLKMRYQWLQGVMVADGTKQLPEGLIRVGEKGRYDVIGYAEAAVVVSGTATAETAILGVPMVVCYHLPGVSRFVVSSCIRVKHFSIPNLVLGERIVTEFINPEPEAIFRSVCRLIEDKDYRAQMITGLKKAKDLLGPFGAIDNIAKDILKAMEKSKFCRA
ncbi:MAG: hypothetical protein ABIK42_03995 [candidate division WOR-3 bacterium]